MSTESYEVHRISLREGLKFHSINRKIYSDVVCYLKEAHIQPLENLGVVKLGVGGTHGCLQDASQVVLIQCGGGSH